MSIKHQHYFKEIYRIINQLPLKNNYEASVLLACTAYVESKYLYRKQIKGPALTIFQIEPFTFNDIYERVMCSNYNFVGLVAKYENDSLNLIENLRDSFAFACLCARAKYYSIPKALPKFNKDNIKQSANDYYDFYKEYYNTPLGKSKKEVCLPLFEDIMQSIIEIED